MRPSSRCSDTRCVCVCVPCITFSLDTAAEHPRHNQDIVIARAVCACVRVCASLSVFGIVCRTARDNVLSIKFYTIMHTTHERACGAHTRRETGLGRVSPDTRAQLCVCVCVCTYLYYDRTTVRAIIKCTHSHTACVECARFQYVHRSNGSGPIGFCVRTLSVRCLRCATFQTANETMRENPVHAVVDDECLRRAPAAAVMRQKGE